MDTIHSIPAEKYAFTMPIKVRDYEVDSQGIVNNAIYLHYLEHTRHEFCEAGGLSFRQMSVERLDPVVHRIDIVYKASLGLGDTALSCLSLRREGIKFIFMQDIYRLSDGHQCVSAEVTIVATRNGRATRGEELVEAFKEYL